jgi:predicted RNA binding protein YcfA (HicA-like mRNA interferase family)
LSSQLTNVSSREAHTALKRLGFEDHKHSGKGSHQVMVREHADDDGNAVRRDVLTLVMGKKEINPFTLKGILDQGNVAVDEFLDAL